MTVEKEDVSVDLLPYPPRKPTADAALRSQTLRHCTIKRSSNTPLFKCFSVNSARHGKHLYIATSSIVFKLQSYRFHAICLGMSGVPDGDFLCPSCKPQDVVPPNRGSLSPSLSLSLSLLHLHAYITYTTSAFVVVHVVVPVVVAQGHNSF
jgi:hypothetical protein